jgi:hypothetical protein
MMNVVPFDEARCLVRRRPFDIVGAEGYAVLKPSRRDTQDYLAKMNDGIKFWQAGRGIPLKSRWNDQWDFVIDKSFDHSKGLGDLSEMNRLIAARTKGYEFLKPLIGDAAEILKGTYAGEEIWLFNITRKVRKEQINELEDDAIFRVVPSGVSILCGPGFKEAIDQAGLTGLWFRPADSVSFV